ncbi:hypothetical protein PISL3812_05317 [Talaromyces islandicus]|uniref:Phosphoinositide phospholipase C n=1 Tax=Talaromyces islandicus TaxID=28573 RepID=A0A0U1LY70_TALIS|nr:hypothetical protein PISL3812_05317 [Talaromyces islandicus]
MAFFGLSTVFALCLVSFFSSISLPGHFIGELLCGLLGFPPELLPEHFSPRLASSSLHDRIHLLRDQTPTISPIRILLLSLFAGERITMAGAEAVGSADTTSFSAAVLAHLKQIYESSRQNDPKLDFGSIQGDESVLQTGKLGADNDNLASLASFLSYMASPVARAHRDAENSDLSSQIAHYYISSSHNTYLTGNQLYSEASAAAYTNVLLRGCRCLEIDVWDGSSRSSSISDSGPTSSSSSSQSDSGNRKQPPNLKGHSRMKSLSDGVRQIVKRAASTRSSKRPDRLRANLKGNAPIKTESTDPRAVREPRVLHGHTLTKEVSFRDVCYAIRDNAFVSSDLPVIVSLEVHADLDQQQMMVDIMREAWNDYLVEIDSREEANLPRLQDLRKKILIKVKWSPPTSTTAEEVAHAEEDIEEAESGVKDLDLAAGENPSSQKKEKKSKILHALSELAVYTRAYHFSHFAQKEAAMPTHVFSLSEAAVKDAHENNRQALLNHNREFLMRVYPSGIRLNSSNLNPIFFWQQGAQMVALNWQNCDKGMMINDAMFPNGVGWVMKPSIYRSISDNADSCNNALPDGTIQNLDLSIEIYAGQNIRKLTDNAASGNSFRPYIICQLHLCKAEDILTNAAELGKHSKAAPGDEKSSTKYKLRTKTSVGNDPDFQAEKIEFPHAEGILQDLSFIRFKIKDNEFGRRDSLVAWACIRLDRLKQGYRFVHLKDHLGQPSAGALLIRINKRVSDS